MKIGWFVRGDIDGFFGLFVDNLLQLMLIAVLCGNVCGMPPELVYGRILPGAALSILFGNGFYTWQARSLARRTGRTDITALPYGINTVSLIAFVFLIIAPIYFATKDPYLAWQDLVSGKLYDQAGGTAIGGANITLVVNGSAYGTYTTLTGASLGEY